MGERRKEQLDDYEKEMTDESILEAFGEFRKIWKEVRDRFDAEEKDYTREDIEKEIDRLMDEKLKESKKKLVEIEDIVGIPIKKVK